MPERDPLLAVAFCAGAHDTPTRSDHLVWSQLRKLCLGKHAEQPQKDGIAYIFAELRGGKCDQNVESVSCLPYDIDGKLIVPQVSCAVSAAAVEAALYTTYNHMKTESTVGAKSFRTWAKANGYDEWATNESMQAFCAANRKYDHLTNVHVGNGGVTVRVKSYHGDRDGFLIEHAPEQKTRVLLPLAYPIPLGEVGKDGYKAIYDAVGQQLFGDSYDPACCNPARLNYAPSCRPDSTGHVIEHHQGSFFNWKPTYESLKDDLRKRREDIARRRAEWASSPPRDLAELHHVLKSIPSDLPRDQWFRVLAALNHETHGSEDGRALAHSWSARDYGDYDFDEVETIWDGFDPDYPNPATMGTLIQLAKKCDPKFVPWRRTTDIAALFEKVVSKS